MKLTPRMAKAINEIVQEEAQSVLRGRKLGAEITRRVDQKPVKLSKLQLKKLISEAITTREPGQPEPFQIDEKFGAYDVENRYDMGNEFDDPDTASSMMPHNFEETHKEIFNQALEPVVKEFVEGLMDMFNAGFAPEGREWAQKKCQETAEEMRAELLKVVEKWTEEGIDRIV